MALFLRRIHQSLAVALAFALTGLWVGHGHASVVALEGPTPSINREAQSSPDRRMLTRLELAPIIQTPRRSAAVKAAIANPHEAGDVLRFPLPPDPGTNEVILTVRWIPPGRFEMGSPADEKDRDRDELIHTVMVNRGFYLAETECTQAQWVTLMKTNRSGIRGESLPATQMTWEDAREYCRRLTTLHRHEGWIPEDWKWELPTESQWEYACRAGTTGAFAGDLDRVAWHAGNSSGKPHPVKTREPNGWGLHDMHGNVWEWCLDWYGDYPLGMAMDPIGSDSGTVRVYRGGNCIYGARRCRSAVRGAFGPALRSDYLGFRPALVRGH